ncbi:CTD small phosphatase 2, putative [Babesia ovis]|uniref:Mitochondrial import inner membrane translocase subunit TIM50 n=1 Tax=Babesia ovis TaxID=5869 RepID=A0A9W5TC16_BABOV|nr:CTD small phosphatase 2, putative [Babesia ovis]
MTRASLYASDRVPRAAGPLDVTKSLMDKVDALSPCALDCDDSSYLISVETDTTVSDDDLFDPCPSKEDSIYGDLQCDNSSTFTGVMPTDGYKEVDYSCHVIPGNTKFEADLHYSYGTITRTDSTICGPLCDASTLTPTSDNDAVYLDDLEESSDYSDDLVTRDQDSLAISPECMIGLLSRYIDCTPQLQNTSMRLLISGEAINDSTIIPSQIIRYNRSHSTRYMGLRDYLEKTSVFKCVRQGFRDTSMIDSMLSHPLDHPKLLVVLDLDETLVHMHDRPDEQHDYLVNIVEHEGNSTSPQEPDTSSAVVGFTVHPTMQVSLRPGVLEFFRYLKQHPSRYTVALYTAGTRHYANAILHALDPDFEVIEPTVRYYRDSCEISSTPMLLCGLRASSLGIGNHHRDEAVPQYYLRKDLSIFGWPLDRVVFFDNSLLSFLNNPDNGVWIRPWQGAQPFINEGHVEMIHNNKQNIEDLTKVTGQDGLYEFGQIISLLEECWAADDVREVLRQKFTLNEVVASALGTAGNQMVLEALIRT